MRGVHLWCLVQVTHSEQDCEPNDSEPYRKLIRTHKHMQTLHVVFEPCAQMPKIANTMQMCESVTREKFHMFIAHTIAGMPIFPMRIYLHVSRTIF